MVGSKIKIKNHRLEIQTPKITNFRVKQLSQRNRIPILALGPLLSRVKKAEVPVLGGDKIGHRPIDFHLGALEKMGARITVKDLIYRAETKGLRGVSVNLPYPSVGATENIILAAVLAKGKTEISGAAVEPEIIDLIKLLQKMGAIIELGVDRKIRIEGVKKLYGATHRIIPDRNEAVSFAVMALATGGKILVKEARQSHLINFLNAVRRLGGDFRVFPEGIEFFRRPNSSFNPLVVETDPHPGFMTDWQQPFCILLTQAQGRSVIHETVYEERFAYTQELKKMGAKVKIANECLGNLPCRFSGKGYNHSCQIQGPTSLRGAEIVIPDIRAGIAHIIAALMAKGESLITGIEHIDRGYENLEERLKSLGARIERIDV
jgi:UDP-N-acetylglucosamine 1-carboxyvinyltransferase